MNYRIECARAENFLASLPDASVDLIATDPPYFGVKDEAWDNAWDSADEFIAWVGGLCKQWARVLRSNGSLYVFASPQMAARVECEVGRHLCVLNRITWRKSSDGDNAGPHARAHKEGLRSFFPQTEAIVFAEHYNSDNAAKGEAGYVGACDSLRGFVFESLRAYLDGERERAGFSAKECNLACGNQMAGHYFSRSQWTLPTEANYEKLRALFNSRGSNEFLRKDYEFLRKDYEFLRKDYEELRKDYEELRRPFFVSASVPYTDVWDFKSVGAYRGKHPCEKPVQLARHIISASSRPGAVVLDTFCGSGVFLAEAVKLGRTAIGCDMDQRWVDATRQRCKEAECPTQPSLLGVAS